MKKDSKGLLWGVLVGSVVGSVTALLFAPKPGKELRKDIVDGTTGAIDKVQEIAGAAGEKSTELYGRAKDAVGSVVSEVKEWGKQYIHDEEEETVTISGIAAEEAAVDADISEAVAEATAEVEEDGADTEAETVVEAALDEDTQNGKDGGELA